MRFEGKVIVITGASDGIGAELARQLAREKARLVLSARTHEALERVAAECRSAGTEALAVPADVTSEEDCRRLIERAIEAFGGIDVLVANAGVSMHARFDAIEDFSTFEKLFRINTMGTVWCVRHAYPHLQRSRGLIVGVSSLAGRVGVPERTTYCASKFAQTGFLDALRVEAADHGIDVMVAYPGVVATELRRRGWNGSGAPAGVSGLSEENAMPVAECARRIIAGMRARRREVIMTARDRVGVWLKLVAPKIVDRMAKAALARPSSTSAMEKAK
ncbi:MAG TPA: SDR family oxidoreductase [Burkholderiaceae bacterium]|nr:SDR family oxidoreductase [Burkholderiaceae bacterium]